MAGSQRRLKEVTVKNILDNFRRIGQPNDDYEVDEETMRRMSERYSCPEEGNYSVQLEDVHRVVSMCGGDLNKFEINHLLKRSALESSEGDETRDVTVNEFTDAVESYVSDANADPESMVLYLFKLKFGDKADFVYLSDVRCFLNEFASYFQGDDLNRFIRDVELDLRMEGDRVELSQLASMIRHATAGFRR